jgi:hypothetical protein
MILVLGSRPFSATNREEFASLQSRWSGTWTMTHEGSTCITSDSSPGANSPARAAPTYKFSLTLRALERTMRAVRGMIGRR